MASADLPSPSTRGQQLGSRGRRRPSAAQRAVHASPAATGCSSPSSTRTQHVARPRAAPARAATRSPTVTWYVVVRHQRQCSPRAAGQPPRRRARRSPASPSADAAGGARRRRPAARRRSRRFRRRLPSSSASASARPLALQPAGVHARPSAPPGAPPASDAAECWSHAQHQELAQRARHAVQALLAVGGVHDQLGDHRVVVDADRRRLLRRPSRRARPARPAAGSRSVARSRARSRRPGPRRRCGIRRRSRARWIADWS